MVGKVVALATSAANPRIAHRRPFQQHEEGGQLPDENLFDQQ